MDYQEVQRRNANKKVVLFNGPPSSGKDTAAIIADNFLNGKYKERELIPYRTRRMKFADPLKMAAHALYGIPYSCEHYEKNFGNKWKDEPQVEFYGKTPRDEYIALSEDYAKTRHGKSVFGRVAARTISLEKSANVFIFSDCGFADEVVPVISLVGVGNVLVVELTRDGCNFTNDSRGYIGKELNEKFTGKIKVATLPNHGDKDDLRLLTHGLMIKHFGVAHAG